MRYLGLAGALLLMCGTAAARSGTDINVECEVNSDYDFSLTQKSLILTHKHGTPKTVLMRQGRLFIDDRWVEVSAADRDRLIAYERDARATMPLAQQIGRDAAGIAFIALGEVAKSLSSNPDKTEAKLSKARVKLDHELASSINATSFNSAALGKGISNAVGDVMPMIMGDIVGGALTAALGGDSDRLDQLDDLDGKIDAIVEPRAKALEKNADRLCMKMRELDAIDNALDYRHNGKPLDLLQVEARSKSDSHD